MPSSLVTPVSIILNPSSSLSECEEAVSSLQDFSATNPYLEHNISFYIIRRCSSKGPLEDNVCARLLEIVSFKYPEALRHLDKLGQSVLFYACRDGRENCVKLVISRFCDPSAFDYHQQSPAFYAAREGHLEILKILADAGVDFDKPDRHGQTPLFYACSNGREETCDFLASEICVDVGLRDNFRRKARNYLPGNLKSLADRLHVFERQKRKFSDISIVPGRRELPQWAVTAREILRTGLWNFQGAVHFQKNAELGNIKRNLEAGVFASFSEIHEKLLPLFSKDLKTCEFYLQLVHCCGLAD